MLFSASYAGAWLCPTPCTRGTPIQLDWLSRSGPTFGQLQSVGPKTLAPGGPIEQTAGRPIPSLPWTEGPPAVPRGAPSCVWLRRGRAWARLAGRTVDGSHPAAHERNLGQTLCECWVPERQPGLREAVADSAALKLAAAAVLEVASALK